MGKGHAVFALGHSYFQLRAGTECARATSEYAFACSRVIAPSTWAITRFILTSHQACSPPPITRQPFARPIFPREDTRMQSSWVAGSSVSGKDSFNHLQPISNISLDCRFILAGARDREETRRHQRFLCLEAGRGFSQHIRFDPAWSPLPGLAVLAIPASCKPDVLKPIRTQVAIFTRMSQISPRAASSQSTGLIMQLGQQNPVYNSWLQTCVQRKARSQEPQHAIVVQMRVLAHCQSSG